MRRSFAFGIAVLIAGCTGVGEVEPEDEESTSESAVDRLPDPSQEDARRAVMSIAKFMGLSMVYEPVSPPENCQGGREGSQVVTSCKTCAVILSVRRNAIGGVQSLAVRKINFTLSFRRGLSEASPRAIPDDPTAGVWVADVPASRMDAQASMPPSYVLSERMVTPQDLAEIGINMRDGPGGLNFSISQGDHLSVIPNGIVLLDFLSSGNAAGKMQSLVGTCGSA